MGAFAIVVRVPDSGLPAWQETILTLIGVGIAFGLLYGVYKLLTLPAARRFRRRVGAVEAAAGADPVFGAAAVKPAAESLYREVQAAWDAGDSGLLGQLTDPGLMADWATRLERNRANGERYRVEVVKGPRIDYVGLVDRPGDDLDYVCVRVRSTLKEAYEKPDGTRRPLVAHTPQTRDYEEYWTLSRRNHRWIVYSTRDAEYGQKHILTEDIVRQD